WVMLVSAWAAASSGSPQPSADVTAHLAYTNSGCNHPSTKPHVAHCLSVVATGSDHQIRADAADPPPTALGPSDIQAAYNLPAAGTGQTVGIVDANGDSNAQADLAVFRAHYGLPPCTTANGCFP